MITRPAIYQDIAARTSGDIYVGVVGPVRTGKSTFIKRFMETMVIPEIEDVYVRERAKDELPQSGSGRTIMTAEPKFVPEEAVKIRLCQEAEVSVRLIDCVGYMVDSAAGQLENGSERMVTTPWFEQEIPMSMAAEEGTRKVITEHSTIGVVITTDGSITDIPRSDYIPAEEKVITELKALHKPFVVLVNSTHPEQEETRAVAQKLQDKYSVACMPVDCAHLDEPGITQILGTALYEFPITEVKIFFPPWIDALPMEHNIRKALYESVAEAAGGLNRISDVQSMMDKLEAGDTISAIQLQQIELGSGEVLLRIEMRQQLYYETISEESGFEISNDGDLMSLLTSMSQIKKEYDRISEALHDVNETGYGVVMPSQDQMQLAEPEIVRRGGRYSVVLKASAPAVHMIKTNIETEVSPAIGGETASEEIMSFLLQGFNGDVSRIWESNIFGKPLYDIANESLAAKLYNMPTEVRAKLQNTLQRIVNEGSGGLICILL